jgi:hypothetical protein
MEESTLQSETLISFKLSDSIKDDDYSLFANIIKNPWISPEGINYNFIRMEFRLNRGRNAKPICVTYTPTQFDWLLINIQAKSNSQDVPGEKEGKFVCFERITSSTDGIVLSVIDRRAKFGILMDSEEQDMLEKYADDLKFVMKFQSARGDKLKELVELIHSSVLSDKIKVISEEICEGCKQESLEHEDHSCISEINKEKFNDLFERALRAEGIKQQFENSFNYYGKLLNISEIYHKEAMNLLLPIVVVERELLLKLTKQFHSKENCDWKQNAILSLSEKKKSSGCDGQPPLKKFRK